MRKLAKYKDLSNSCLQFHQRHFMNLIQCTKIKLLKWRKPWQHMKTKSA
ncbi:hypothetical protein P5673_017692 [Acropora cervicornis]|uniref:Uncharacterized protein n=1 Tax=Acropora cervicornis TaxID=6130 RepID=A0AAD9QE58_ACRCE|nr:hypothetical protein P5673_017692 [Acropora cervicornis]